MINRMQMALIGKDIRSITANRRLLLLLWIIPLTMTVVIPSLFMFLVGFTPLDSPDFKELMVMLPKEMQVSDIRPVLIQMLVNDVIPIFFLVIPIMTSTVMAASSFVGEKERRTLETLLYCPLSLKQIFSAKIIAALVLSQLVSCVSFVAMALVVETEMWLIMGSGVFLGLNWLVLMLLVSPAISLVAITLIVRGSAKAQSVEESQQRGAFLVLPVVLLAVGQVSGLMRVSVWILLAMGIGCVIIGMILLHRSSVKFNYERLLQ